MNLWAAILLALATASCHLGCYAQAQEIPPSYGVEALQQNVQVQARGLPGIQFLLQSSTDLSAWENQATNTFTKPELIHSQPVDENAPALFFRTVIVPE